MKADTRPATGSLWRDRDFLVFWCAQTLSVAGDSFALIAVPLLVLNVTGSVAQMGLLTGVSGAASVAAGVFAGVLADRFDRRRLLVACDVIRLVLYATIPVVWVFGQHVWLLYAVLPMAAAVGMLFQVTYVAAVRGLAGETRVTEANGMLYATAAAAGILGPSLAGVVSGHLGPTAAIALNAASFGLSAVGVLLTRASRYVVEPVEPTPGRRPWRELLAGAEFLFRHPVLRTLTILLSFFIFMTLGLTDIVIYRLKHDLGQPDSVVGVVLGVGAAGTMVGSMLVARMRRMLGFGPLWIGAQVVSGLAILGLGLAGSVWGVAAIMALYLACVSLAGICSMSLRQQVTPAHLLGRVTSAFWTIHFSLGPVGAAALGWAAARHGATAVFIFAGASCLLLALVALATPVRQRHPERA
ncbi:putative MFS family arabinose efflux permease [Nonomuraea polychroma]|uniref:Putative MFS family arabinose efflux permease n=1 Tax=Nonomuraea polychroma TaxID=46176 RepID=A0A438MH24_9ACTN|nr:MFS transporter [Nonomuraea polychroma]RVX45053.1 putative MFS family arabinose efflux permease [Nonomuraea polychroma]